MRLQRPPATGVCPCGATTSGPRRRCRSCVSREHALAYAAARQDVRVFAVMQRASGSTWKRVAEDVERVCGWRPSRTTLHAWVRQRRPDIVSTDHPGARPTVAGLRRQLAKAAGQVVRLEADVARLREALQVVLEAPCLGCLDRARKREGNEASKAAATSVSSPPPVLPVAASGERWPDDGDEEVY